MEVVQLRYWQCVDLTGLVALKQAARTLIYRTAPATGAPQALSTHSKIRHVRSPLLTMAASAPCGVCHVMQLASITDAFSRQRRVQRNATDANQINPAGKQKRLQRGAAGALFGKQ